MIKTNYSVLREGMEARRLQHELSSYITPILVVMLGFMSIWASNDFYGI